MDSEVSLLYLPKYDDQREVQPKIEQEEYFNDSFKIRNFSNVFLFTITFVLDPVFKKLFISNMILKTEKYQM